LIIFTQQCLNAFIISSIQSRSVVRGKEREQDEVNRKQLDPQTSRKVTKVEIAHWFCINRIFQSTESRRAIDCGYKQLIEDQEILHCMASVLRAGLHASSVGRQQDCGVAVRMPATVCEIWSIRRSGNANFREFLAP